MNEKEHWRWGYKVIETTGAAMGHWFGGLLMEYFYWGQSS